MQIVKHLISFYKLFLQINQMKNYGNIPLVAFFKSMIEFSTML